MPSVMVLGPFEGAYLGHESGDCLDGISVLLRGQRQLPSPLPPYEVTAGRHQLFQEEDLHKNGSVLLH